MKIRSKLLTKFVGWLVALVFRGLARTLRIHGHIETAGSDPSISTRETFIYTLWHDEILIPLARQSLTRPRVVALVSRHQDGAYLAEFMRHLGIRAVRGSTARGGDQALRDLVQCDPLWHMFVTPDGPRGPRHEVKDGVIYLASRTGRRIVPIVSFFEDAWYIPGSWTGLWLPKPFGHGWYLLGEPIAIPPGLSRDEITWQRHYVQAATDQLAAKLARIVRGSEPAGTYSRAA